MLNWRYRRILLRHFREGEPFAYPTESVFGIGCDPFNPVAVERVKRLKGRVANKGMIICAASLAQVAPFLTAVTPDERRFLERCWPGPTTVVVPVPPDSDWDWLMPRYQQTLALRVSAHPVVQTLCDFLGPIVSTSANISGLPPCRHYWQVRRVFPDLACVVAGQVGLSPRPTRVIDLRTRQVLRA